jgi:acetoin utilization deacetylase AcuC-like enzyme
MEDIMPQTRIIYHDRFLTDYPTASVERPERVKNIHAALKEKGYRFTTAVAATENDIARVHYPSLIDAERRDPDRFEVALLSAGGAIMTAEIALNGTPAFGLIRPPGHHASQGSNWGFCFFNNMAVAMAKLIDDGKIRSAVVLDIDLHFGDGTDNIFSGKKHNDGEVTVINIQSHNRMEFLALCHQELKEAAPYDIIGVSAGFDAYIKDWGGTLMTEDYRTIGETVKEMAQKYASGRRFALLEGGYYLNDLGKNALSLIEGME